MPDIRIGVERYRADGDADRFVDRTTLVASAEKGVAARIRCLATGARHHQWMYDGPSLCRLLEKAGFEEVAVVEPGVTRIPPRARWTCINVRPTASSWRRRAPDSGPGFREQTLEGPAPALPGGVRHSGIHEAVLGLRIVGLDVRAPQELRTVPLDVDDARTR